MREVQGPEQGPGGSGEQEEPLRRAIQVYRRGTSGCTTVPAYYLRYTCTCTKPTLDATTSTTAAPRPVVGALTAAALEVGRRAWHAGENIQTAVTLAGYSAALAQGVYEYFTQHATPELEAASQSHFEEMGPQVKRGRYSQLRSTVRSRGRSVPVAPTVKRYVKRCMDRVIEDKWTQAALVTMNPGTAGTVTQVGLSAIQRGTTANTRTGNHIRPKFFRMRLSCRNDGGNQNGQRVRFIIVVDNQCNGAAATISDVFDNSNVLGMYNPLYVQGCGGKRFKILYDKTVDLNPPVVYDGVNVVSQIANRSYNLTFGRSSLPATVGYDADTGAVSDLADKNVFMVSIADDAQCAIYYTTWWCYQDA